MQHKRRIFITLALAAALGTSASAATMVYTTPADFAAATKNPTSIGFNGILTPPQTFANFNPLTVAGISFATPNAGTLVNVTAADYYGAGSSFPADFIVNSSNPGNNELDVTFSAPTFAFGLDYGAFSGGGLGTVTLSDGTSYLDTSLPGLANTRFVGFVSDTAISSFSFVASGDAWIVEDLVIASPTPEPQSWILAMSTLLLGIPVARRFGNMAR